MKIDLKNPDTVDFRQLCESVAELQVQFKNYAYTQVNSLLTMRNWLIGRQIFEFEQGGRERAEYGDKLYKQIVLELKRSGAVGLSKSILHLCVQLYKTYPQIVQALPGQFNIAHPQIVQAPTGQFNLSKYDDKLSASDKIAESSLDLHFTTPPEVLINRLSFTHIVELLKADSPLKRYFYETESIKNNWSSRELQRAMNSMLYERVGLSENKEDMLSKYGKRGGSAAINITRDPYVLEFLELKEKSEYTERDLEQAIIDHLQSFLMELGHGFCFEARQKRITFDNTHYYIDLVFYHRILKCHVLIDLKLGEFTHADAGQMNVYLNYYKENEKSRGDKNPIGLIMCAGKNEQLVKYATGGLPHKLFVSKYLINLPNEDDLKKIIREEQRKLAENA